MRPAERRREYTMAFHQRTASMTLLTSTGRGTTSYLIEALRPRLGGLDRHDMLFWFDNFFTSQGTLG